MEEKVKTNIPKNLLMYDIKSQKSKSYFTSDLVPTIKTPIQNRNSFKIVFRIESSFKREFKDFSDHWKSMIKVKCNKKWYRGRKLP